MLYVFFVDTGTMLQFEMNYALESVAQLGEAIEKRTRIPHDKQVLLVSGGESLDSTARVCSYSAGTDTNPIFLFSKVNTECVLPSEASVNYGMDQDLKEQVEESESLEPNYSSVLVRTQLAQQFFELAREQTLLCERLVHDQHLMQQGWAAVVANLEDITANYRNVCENFKLVVVQFLQNRDDAIQLVENYRQDINILSKIPIIPALLEDWADLTLSCASSGHSSKESSLQRETVEEKQEKEAGDGAEQQKPVKEVDQSGGSPDIPCSYKTLLQWIDAKDKRFSIEGVAELCTRCLNQIHSSSFEKLRLEAETVMEAATKQELKEIKGLEERLYGLEQLMYEARRLVQEQKDMSMALQQNQKRVSNLKDPSILPDLCASHQRQLKVMLENQHRLMDIRRRCTKAKEELSNNLFHRLRWVVYSENRMFDMNSKLLVYLENTKRLRRTIDVVRQVHLTPAMYLRAVSEVVRRRSFSQAFLLWACGLACQLMTVHNEEVTRRKDFQAQFSGHFLNSLFTGMDDIPPAFATQAPSPFDTQLPKLTLDDVQKLQDQIPELSSFLTLPDVDSISNFFLSKLALGTVTSNETTKEEKVIEGKLAPCEAASLLSGGGGEASKSIGVSVQTPALSKDVDRGFESETDTEEFEKVGQSPVKLLCSEAAEGAIPCLPGHNYAMALLEVGVPDVKKLQAPISPSSSCSVHSPGLTHSHLSSQHYQHTLQEFATTEYYIDDSMPSSCTESLGGKCQHVAAPEVLRQLEDLNTLVALLQENLGNTRNELECLRNHLAAAGHIVAEAVGSVRQDLLALRVSTSSHQEVLISHSRELLLALDNHHTAVEEQEKARRAEEGRLVQQLTIEHELEMDALKQEMKICSEVKDEEIRLLKQDNDEKDCLLTNFRVDVERRIQEEVASRSEVVRVRDLEAKLAETQQQVRHLQEQLDNAEVSKQQAVHEVEERLNHDYKTELENLRSRYRLMATASMERSPSDSSLERIERADLIELMNHEAILQQVRDDLEDEREAAVKSAVERERAMFEARLEYELRLARTRSEAERQVWFNEAMRRMMEEKDKQVEALRARESTLTIECQRHQDTIRNLTDCRETGGSLDSKTSGSTVWQLLDRIESLKTAKRHVEAELARERSRKNRTLSETALSDGAPEPKIIGQEMSSSVAVVQEANAVCDVPSSADQAHRGLQEDRLRDKLSQSTTSLIQQGKISILSCNIGDIVLVVWDEEHQNYTILQESSTLYFLHSDCWDSLGLRPSSDDAPRRLYSIGEVIEKEYCHAKKPENRYRVPKGTKFHRVRVRPLQRDRLLMRSHHSSKQRQQHHPPKHELQKQITAIFAQKQHSQEKQGYYKENVLSVCQHSEGKALEIPGGQSLVGPEEADSENKTGTTVSKEITTETTE